MTWRAPYLRNCVGIDALRPPIRKHRNPHYTNSGKIVREIHYVSWEAFRASRYSGVTLSPWQGSHWIPSGSLCSRIRISQHHGREMSLTRAPFPSAPLLRIFSSRGGASYSPGRWHSCTGSRHQLSPYRSLKYSRTKSQYTACHASGSRYAEGRSGSAT